MKNTNFFKLIAPITTALLFFISALNLHLYWSNFNIDIFSYLSPSDIIMKSTTTMITGITSIIGLFIVETWGQYHRASRNNSIDAIEKHIEENRIEPAKIAIKKEKERIKKIRNLERAFGKPVDIAFTILIAASFILGATIQIYQESGLHIPIYISSGALLLIKLYSDTELSAMLYDKYKVPATTIPVIIMFSAATTANTISSSKAIENGENYIKFETADNDALKVIDQNKDYGFLGEINNKIFLWDISEKKTLAINQSNMKSYTLIKSGK